MSATTPPLTGNDLRARRLAAGLNQRDAAYHARVSTAYLSTLENKATIGPGRGAVERLLRVYTRLERQAERKAAACPPVAGSSPWSSRSLSVRRALCRRSSGGAGGRCKPAPPTRP